MSETTDGETVTDPPAGAPSVLLLSTGERSRELASAFGRLGAQVTVCGDMATMTDADALTALIDGTKPRYVLADAGAVATDALLAVAERDDVDVFPTPRGMRLSLDGEGLRRLAADELGLPTAPFWFAGSVDELTAIAQHAGFPLLVKPVVAAPGEGESIVLRTAEGTKFSEMVIGGEVLFEADDHTESSAWSVIVRGQARRLETEAEIAHAETLPLKPMVPTLKRNYVRIDAGSISGRSFELGEEPSRDGVQQY